MQFTDEEFLSLTCWTIVGACVVSAEKNDTSTILDTVLYDIKSKKMLFRAPGTSVVKDSATPVNLSEERRVDSIEGFDLAADKMTENLNIQLEGFKEKTKKNPEQIKIVHSEGCSGSAGSISFYELAIFLLIAVARRNFKNSSGGGEKHSA